jgi:hypothetical protein
MQSAIAGHSLPKRNIGVLDAIIGFPTLRSNTETGKPSTSPFVETDEKIIATIIENPLLFIASDEPGERHI